MKSVRHLLLLFTMIGALSWACGDSSPLAPSGPADNEVWIQNSQFNPNSLTVSPGTTVVWINKDNDIRDVQSGTPMNPTSDFASKNLDTNETFPHPFPKAGVFNYYSIITGATGVIIVQP